MNGSSISGRFCRRQLRTREFALAAVPVPASAVQPAEIEGVRLLEPLQMGEAQLQRRGAGFPRDRHVVADDAALRVRVRDLDAQTGREHWVQR